jgi:hypothetical protein
LVVRVIEIWVTGGVSRIVGLNLAGRLRQTRAASKSLGDGSPCPTRATGLRAAPTLADSRRRR